MNTKATFPPGGPRQPVYDFLRDLQFTMSPFSDKHWTRLDGIELDLYGAGSMARVYVNGTAYQDCPLADVAEAIKAKG